MLTLKSTPAGGAADPRGALDFLYQAGKVTRREYDAGRLYAACFISCDLRCAAIVDHCEDVLDRIEIDRGPMLRRVVSGHKTPVTSDGLQRFRDTLSRLAIEFEQVELGWLEKPAPR